MHLRTLAEYTITDNSELDFDLGVGFMKLRDGSLLAAQTVFIL